jgi:hypothetical protein
MQQPTLVMAVVFIATSATASARCGDDAGDAAAETSASDVAQLSGWLVISCNFSGTYPAVVGRCVPATPPGSTTCVPGG